MPPVPAPTGPALATRWLHTARFLTSAPRLADLPAIGAPEVAFVGRSNAGKSTAINVLAQQKKLAFVSKRPGRTQHINLFAVGRSEATDLVIADLPGYGFAAVAQEHRVRWQQAMADYLVTRESLAGVVVLSDVRRGLAERDDALLELIRPRVAGGLRLLVLLTKADKLTREQQARAVSEARAQVGGADVMAFSALRRLGVEQTAQWVHALSRDAPR